MAMKKILRIILDNLRYKSGGANPPSSRDRRNYEDIFERFTQERRDESNAGGRDIGDDSNKLFCD